MRVTVSDHHGQLGGEFDWGLEGGRGDVCLDFVWLCGLVAHLGGVALRGHREGDDHAGVGDHRLVIKRGKGEGRKVGLKFEFMLFRIESV